MQRAEQEALSPPMQKGRLFSEPDAASSQQAGVLLCALLLVVSAGALGVSVKMRTAGSTDAAPGNIEARGSVEAPRPPPPAGVQTVEPAEPPRTASVAPDNDEPRQPIANGVKSSAATSSLPALSPAPPNEQPVEAQGPATPEASKTVAVAHTPVEKEAKHARTKSRARVRQARVRSLPGALVLWLNWRMTPRRGASELSPGHDPFSGRSSLGQASAGGTGGAQGATAGVAGAGHASGGGGSGGGGSGGGGHDGGGHDGGGHDGGGHDGGGHDGGGHGGKG
jgi:hypothetical protein